MIFLLKLPSTWERKRSDHQEARSLLCRMAASVEQNKGSWNWDFLAAVGVFLAAIVNFGIDRTIFVVALRRGLTLAPTALKFMILQAQLTLLTLGS